MNLELERWPKHVFQLNTGDENPCGTSESIVIEHPNEKDAPSILLPNRLPENSAVSLPSVGPDNKIVEG